MNFIYFRDYLLLNGLQKLLHKMRESKDLYTMIYAPPALFART